MRGTYESLRSSHEEQIKSLEAELYWALTAIVDLMPEDMRGLLTRYYSCRSRAEAHQWEADVIETLLNKATLLPRDRFALSDRAYCPLCRDGSSSRYEEGFSHPEGLRRHLVGWGSMRQCSVLAAAMKIARRYWDSEFSEAEHETWARDTTERQQRRTTETLYLVAPDGDPELIDEQQYFSKLPRDEPQMRWAEDRLTSLGFTINTDGRVKSYVHETADYAVFADPRMNGEIQFTVYRLPLPKKTRGRQPRVRVARSFRIADSWKNDLVGKFRDRVFRALAE
jgi:hypothetical protein